MNAETLKQALKHSEQELVNATTLEQTLEAYARQLRILKLLIELLENEV